MKCGIWVIIAGILIWALSSFIRNSAKPLPGENIPEIGRDHITDIAGVDYNSNPPTSGSHFAVWAKPGVYDRLISDGYLIHSLEHGYIVISYDCQVKGEWQEVKSSFNFKLLPFTFLVLAHDEPAKESTDSGELLKHLKYDPEGDMSWFTPENPPQVEVELPEEFKTDSCKDLVSKLSEFTKAAERVIVVPHLDLDTSITLTAWGRIDKLESVNEEEIKDFIKAYHNKGPEKTME